MPLDGANQKFHVCFLDPFGDGIDLPETSQCIQTTCYNTKKIPLAAEQALTFHSELGVFTL